MDKTPRSSFRTCNKNGLEIAPCYSTGEISLPQGEQDGCGGNEEAVMHEGFFAPVGTGRAGWV